MSAGGFVWIKLATAKEDVFARVVITSSDLVTDVAERSCAKFPRWHLDAGQVRLLLVAKAGAPKPQVPAPEAFKDLKPLAEEATLESAGVTSGAWLVAVPAPASGSGGGSGGSSAKHTAEDLLAIAGVHPVQQSVLLRAAQRYGGMLSYAVTSGKADIAKEAYDMAAMLPSLTTVQRFSAQGILVNGPLFEGSIITLAFRGTQVFVVKPLDKKETQRLFTFLEALDGLTLPHVVPFSIHCSAHEHAEGDADRNKHFMLMPKYSTSLEPLSLLDEDDALRLWVHMHEALTGIHALGFCHMDVKPPNICITERGEFFLIDLGSVCRIGARSSSTPAYVPMDLGESIGHPSRDWWMLAMSLAEKCCGVNCVSVGSGGRSMKTADLRNHLEQYLPQKIWVELAECLP